MKRIQSIKDRNPLNNSSGLHQSRMIVTDNGEVAVVGNSTKEKPHLVRP